MKNTKLWGKIRDSYLKKAYYHVRFKPFVYQRNIGNERMQFFVDSFHVFLHASGYNKFEPETQEFIKKYYKPGEVVFDIGANHGIFSFYSSTQGCSVYAFEPHPHNYSRFVRNIELNKKQKWIKAYCVACYKKTIFGGISKFDDIFSTFDEHQDVGCVSFSVDDIVRYLPFPDHIKIDVDGNEPDVIDGMMTVLLDKRLKTLLVEFHPKHVSQKDADRCRKIISDAGFVLIGISTGTELNHFYVHR